FTWRDGDRVVRFGRGAVDGFEELLGAGYLLLTTERAAAQAPAVVAAAGATLHVPPGRVDEVAAGLLDAVRASRGATTSLVALGGGRVIDTAKALGAATGRAVAAIPTTLSSAEMTWVHRHVAGLEPVPAFVRPKVVLNDPALSASQPPAELAASAANSLGHAVEGAATTLTSPVPRLACREAARLIGAAFEDERAPDRDALALASLLSGYGIDAAWYGMHHVLAQTLVREAGAGHGPANATLLPHTMRALERRGLEVVAAPALAARLARLAGAERLTDIGIDADDAALARCAEVAAARRELGNTPPPAERAEIRAIYAAARDGIPGSGDRRMDE
ncbi:MAG TPA: iron-containing alcohol dehydrogenase, partial [Solirubrobacteraceae bacterium]|nr:iron-containing alcohol dehydrogenase [Solirubrobacteraceae bacterium]